MKEKILEKFNNLLKDTVSSSDLNYLNIKEEAIVVEVNNSVIVAKGFTKISFEECVIISGKFKGIVSVINKDIIKIMLLEKTNEIKVGDKVKRTFEALTIPVNETLIGRIIDGLGKPLDNKGPIKSIKKMMVERPAVNIIDRKSVCEPMQTGIKVVDSLIPIGRGQRELILGDRQTGKTSIAVDAILNQKDSDVICIYCAIGQRDSTVANIIKILQDNGAMDYTIVVNASGNEIAGHQFIAPYSATSIAEYFMEQGKHVLIVYDDLTKQAKAYREVSLLLEKNPGREAYPADIFYIHSRLLERSTKMKDELGGGSITSLPIIETEAENISAYVPTNVISITDGQIYLSPNLFQKGILPAIDVEKSVSRVGSSAQLPAYKQATGTLGIEYSQFQELESFSKFATSLDEETEKIINRGKRIREILKQKNINTLSACEQIAILLCLNYSVFDNVPLEKVVEVEKIAINAMNTEFVNIKNTILSKKKIPEEKVNIFVNRVKELLTLNVIGKIKKFNG